jgi:hypothetical protein
MRHLLLLGPVEGEREELSEGLREGLEVELEEEEEEEEELPEGKNEFTLVWVCTAWHGRNSKSTSSNARRPPRAEWRPRRGAPRRA